MIDVNRGQRRGKSTEGISRLPAAHRMVKPFSEPVPSSAMARTVRGVIGAGPQHSRLPSSSRLASRVCQPHQASPRAAAASKTSTPRQARLTLLPLEQPGD